MLDLVVKCEKAREGCEWEGEIRFLDQHKLDCLTAPTRCPNEGCDEIVPYSLVQAHLDDNCPFTVLHCRYSEAGCEIELPRRDLEAHENDLKLHLQVVTKYSQDKITALQTASTSLQSDVKKVVTANTSLQSKVQKLMRENSSLKSDLEKLTAALRNTLKDNLLTFKVTEYRRKRNENIVFYSPSFYTSSEGYRMQIMVYTNGDNGRGKYISVYVCLKRGEYDNKLKWPFVGGVTITLLNQLEDARHYHNTLQLTTEYDTHVGRACGYPCFIRQAALRYNGKNYTQYLKNDTLYFRVSVWNDGNQPWLHCTV